MVYNLYKKVDIIETKTKFYQILKSIKIKIK